MPFRKSPQTSIQPALLHRLLIPQHIKSIQIAGDFADIETSSGTVRVELASSTLSSSYSWIVLMSAELVTKQGTFTLAGLPHSAVLSLTTAIAKAKHRSAMLDQLRDQSERVARIVAEWDNLASRDAYLSNADTIGWIAQTELLSMPQDADSDLIDRLPPDLARGVRRVITLKSDIRKASDQRNVTYAKKQLQAFTDFFDTIESNPLTEQQQLAIVHDEDNALVIAGAGTGKTSTIVGKVGFIIRKGWAKPDEILLLSFTTKSAAEMKERIFQRLSVEVKVRTFHALGLEVIAQGEGKKPSLAPEAEDVIIKAATFKELIAKRLPDDDFRQNLLAFQSALRRPYKPTWEFQSLGDYTRYLLDVEPRSLSGRMLKSVEECDIANWLLLNGIKVEYERRYEVDTATVDYRQYKPDFYLPDFGVYIEHFGIDRNGRTAPFVDQAKYAEGMAWKRTLHAEHQTTLIETYSWERQEGVLLANLEAKLQARGIQPVDVPPEQILKMLNDAGRVDPFITLVGTFLSLYKSASLSADDLRQRVGRVEHPERALAFISVFEQLASDYDLMLRARGEIDFDDMIGLAREHVERGRYRSGFKYILIDEFQDIAMGRASLILALRNQVRGAKLFCVGDDWQSIYRFTGSDLSITTEFDKFFGFTRRTDLDRTFRFDNKIADFSSRFVQRNPNQLRKQLSTQTMADQPGVVICAAEPNDGIIDGVIGEIASTGKASVFVLARYKHDLPQGIATLRRRYPQLSIEPLTVHASKGLEADYVLVNNLGSGKHGFPSEMADDPVLKLVLPEVEQFEFAEERRLFYVALTRTKKRVYVIANSANPSAFVREILADPLYEKIAEGSISFVANACPVCERGQVKRHGGQYGIFYSCSNFPICSYKAPTCSRCKQGRMRDTGDTDTEATCDSCGFRGRMCPQCRTGVLVVRQARGSGREFWGCSNYGRAEEKCGYTERL